jgi:hypothetical protein
MHWLPLLGCVGLLGVLLWRPWPHRLRLARTYGEEFQACAARVGRFVPGIGRLHGPQR